MGVKNMGMVYEDASYGYGELVCAFCVAASLQPSNSLPYSQAHLVRCIAQHQA